MFKNIDMVGCFKFLKTINIPNRLKLCFLYECISKIISTRCAQRTDEQESVRNLLMRSRLLGRNGIPEGQNGYLSRHLNKPISRRWARRGAQVGQSGRARMIPFGIYGQNAFKLNLLQTTKL